MTGREQKAYKAWSRNMDTQGDMRDTYFKQMQALFEESGGGRASCSLEGNLSYLLTSNDETTRNRALMLYRKYYEADAKYTAFMELAQGLANAK